MLGLDAPGVSRSNVTANVIGHRSLAAFINGADNAENVVGSDITRELVAPEGVGDLVQARFCLWPGGFASLLEVRDVCLEEIGDRAGARVTSELDTFAFQDHFGEVAIKNFSRFGKRYSGKGANLRFGTFSVSPLLSHPLTRHPASHC